MDYEEIGLKCGIEIHQQLEGKKLFCNCPTLIRDEEAHFVISRKLRASAGESGKIDVAAEQEQLRNRTFLYQGYKDTTCLVETDSEPPHEINQDALYTTLQFCKFVKAKVVPIVQVMRKTVVDGSNTSGFQRTALLARQGLIRTADGEVRIDNVSLEEDACRIIEDGVKHKTYRLDRLGIPLIEIGTAPDIKTPQQCQDAAKKLGLILRSLPGVKRGLGTIRQDVNVSVKGGSRVEIKGAQDLRQLPNLVELEIKRQQELLKIKKELNLEKLNEFKIIDLSELLKNSPSKIIKSTFEKKGKILSIKINNFAGFVGRELQPGKRLGTEFSQRAKVKAGVGGIFHSDELPNYGITAEEVEKIKDHLHCKEKDAFILVAAEEQKAKIALSAVYQRAEECLEGIPQEVRKANQDATTTFLRPMPGAARMYPETDVPLIRPQTENIELPELLERRILRYQRIFNLSADLAEYIAKSKRMLLFEELITIYKNIKPAFIAETLTSTLIEIKRKYELDAEKLTDEELKLFFKYLDQGKLHKDITIDVLMDMIKGEFNINKYASLSSNEIEEEIKKIVLQHKNAPFSALMGLAMKQLNGKASGKVISELLKKIVEKK